MQLHGANALRYHHVTATSVLLRQPRNPLLLLLLLCATVSGFTGDPTDATITGGIVLVSVGLSFVNEYRAEAAVEALHSGVRHRAVVWRDSHRQQVDSATIVPGDVVDIAVGNIVAGDLRLLSVDELECDEAVLTGEPCPSPRLRSDAEALSHSTTWDIRFVRRFMLVFGAGKLGL